MTGVPPARPLVHFTPPSGWLNDPNGLVHDGTDFHLCYQHHPDSLAWGPMHWGHATSRDLLTWEHRPIALAPDSRGAVFSGSALVDREGSAGSGKDALVAFFTAFREGEPQEQCVASSSDGGRTWRRHARNPVLTGPPGQVDFRDPKVVRFDDSSGEGHWVMAVAAGDQVIFHRSDDLVDWQECGRFGGAHGAHGGVWETPDLFWLPLGADDGRWVLSVSVLGGGPAGGSATQYFLGRYDGATFRCDDGPETVRWVDQGADFYAPQSWSDVPDGRRIWLAWLSNWDYGRETPASGWRGAMTIPRELSLVRDQDGVGLAQRPVRELDDRRRVIAAERDLAVAPQQPWEIRTGPAVDLQVSWLTEGTDGELCVEVHTDGGPTQVRYRPLTQELSVLPWAAGIVAPGRSPQQSVRVPARDGVLALRVVVDTCSVEVFADDGRVVLSNQVFPAEGAGGVRVFTEGGTATVAALEVAELAAG